MRWLLAVLLFVLAGAAQTTHPWDGILPPSRGIDWTTPGCCWVPNTASGTTGGVMTPIPHRTVLCGDPISPSPTSQMDQSDWNAINNRLSDCGWSQLNAGAPCNASVCTGSCPAPGCVCPPSTGCVVQLTAGNFYLAGSINWGQTQTYQATKPMSNNITLRGMGPDQTTLITRVYGNGAECGGQGNWMCIWGARERAQSNTTFTYTGACSWDAGYAQGTSVLTFNNCRSTTVAGQVIAGPRVGMHIILDQRNDDIGLSGCSSVAAVPPAQFGTATCLISLNPAPPEFQVGACVGVGSQGTPAGTWPTGTPNSLTDVAAGTVWGTVYASGYGITPYRPQRPIADQLPGGAGPGCSAILAMGMDNGATSVLGGGLAGTGLPWFSYTLCCDAGPLVTIGPCTRATTGPAGTGTFGYNQVSGGLPNSPASDGSFPCGWATVDTHGMMVTGILGVTSAALAGGTGPTVGGGIGLATGRQCPNSRLFITITDPGSVCQNDEISYRSQAQIVTVTNTTPNPCVAGSACQVTIDHPILGNNWRQSQAPGAWWITQCPTGDTPTCGSGWHYMVGVEDLTMEGLRDGGATVNGGFNILACWNCWFKNVRTVGGPRNHFWLQDGVTHFTIRDSYFWGSKRGASQSYGVEFDGMLDQILIENNIFVRIVTGLEPAGSFQVVSGYNYFQDAGYAPGTLMAQIQPHGVNGLWLMEGDNTARETNDSLHGTFTGAVTAFRERWRGQDAPPQPQALASNVTLAYIRGFDVIGSVLGTQGWQSNPAYYNRYATGLNWSGNDISCLPSYTQCIFTWGDPGQGSRPVGDDRYAQATSFRWGNYDTITDANSGTLGAPGNGVRWCATGSETGCSIGAGLPGQNANGSEIPTLDPVTGQQFPFLPPMTAPATHNLPASFYLSGMPPFWHTQWGTPPFPAIGPDVTGGCTGPQNFTGTPVTGEFGVPCDGVATGMSHPIPAQIAYANAPVDMNYVMTPNTITAGSWVASGGGCNGLPCATLTGQFAVQRNESFTITGAQPDAYNGTWQAYYNSSTPTCCTNGPAPSANSSWSWSSGGDLPSGNYFMGTTAVNQFGETTMSGTSRQSGQSGTCPTSGSCQIVFTGNAGNNGYGDAANTGYNYYMRGWPTDTTYVFCKQNPTPLGTGQTWTVTAENFIQGNGTYGATGNPAPGGCVQPPLTNTALGTITQFYMPVPGGTNPGPMTVMGTMTGPVVKVFNANQYYYGAAPPAPSCPTPLTGCIQGNGVIK